MSKSVDLILSAVKSAGEAALRLHEESESLRARLAEAEALLREIYGRDRHFDSGAWLIRMYHGDYARIHALITPSSAAEQENDA